MPVKQTKILHQKWLSSINGHALGDTKRGLKELTSDLLNRALDQMTLKDVANETYLTPATLKRVRDCEPFYNPQSQTIERILRMCGASLTASVTTITAKNQNKPKVKRPKP